MNNEDLIERLRKPALSPNLATADRWMIEAADELEAQAARIAELEDKYRKLSVAYRKESAEAFCGNIDALSKLDLDAMDAQPILLAVQNWDISTGRARELLRCWVLGTLKLDMLPDCGPELFADDFKKPREVWATKDARIVQLEADLRNAEEYIAGHSQADAFGRLDHDHDKYVRLPLLVELRAALEQKL